MQSLGNALPNPTATEGSYRSEREYLSLAPPNSCWPIAHNYGQLCPLEIIDSRESKSWSVGQTHFVTSGQHVRLSLWRQIRKFPRANYLQVISVYFEIRARHSHVVYWQDALIRQIEDRSHGAERRD